MLGTLEDRHGADLTGSDIRRNDQANVIVAVVQDLGDAIMQEADADHALAGAHVLAGAGTGLGVDLDVLVELNQVLEAIIMTLVLQHQVGNQKRSAGGHVVGEPDQAAVLGLEQIVPGLGRFQIQALELILVYHEAQDASIDAVPVAVRILVQIAQQVLGVLGYIAVIQEALGSQRIIGIVGAAEPYVGRGLAVFFLDLGGNLVGGQALRFHLDAEHLFELVAGGFHIEFLAGTVNYQLAFGLSGSDQLGVKLGIGTGKAYAAEHENGGQQNGQDLFH